MIIFQIFSSSKLLHFPYPYICYTGLEKKMRSRFPKCYIGVLGNCHFVQTHFVPCHFEQHRQTHFGQYHLGQDPFRPMPFRPKPILANAILANAISANSHFGQFSLVSMRIAGMHNCIFLTSYQISYLIYCLYCFLGGCKWPNEGKVGGEEKVAFICLT